MPASSWSALQEYESQFDAALEAILSPFAAAPYSFTLYPQQAADVLASPRLEYQFSLGRPAGPGSFVQMRATRGVAARIMAYHFSLLFRFVYDRRHVDPAAVGFKGALREMLAPPVETAPETAAFNLTTLPWLNVTDLAEVRAIRGIVAGDEKVKQRDAWESTWDGIFNIRDEALEGI